MDASTHDDHGHDAHHVNYLMIFVALCVFTLISITTEIVPFPNHASLVVTVFAVSCAKAFCVLAFFMHLKFEGNWKYLLLAPTTVLAVGLPIALLPDVGVHYYTTDVPQNDDYARMHAEEHLESHGEEPHDDGKAEGENESAPETPDE